MKIITSEELRKLQKTLELEGFIEVCTCMGGDPTTDGIHYVHPDGRSARIYQGEIHRGTGEAA